MTSPLDASEISRARQTSILVVLDMLGVRTKKIGTRNHVGPCPRCGGHDRFAVSTRKQVFNCRGCEAKGDVIALVQHVDGCSFSEAVERLIGGRWRPSSRVEPGNVVKTADEDRAALASAARYVAEMRAIISAPIALAYLERVRKIDVAAIEDVLSRIDAIGWHPAVYFNELEYPKPGDPPHPLHGQRLGAIIGEMTDAKTAKPTGAISRTYLAPEGTKVLKAKTLASPRGIIRLSPDDAVEAGLFIAEGMETALAGMAIGLRPMWATGDRGVMSEFPLLAGIEALSVVADNDASGDGQQAAQRVAARWRAAGRDVRMFLPKAEGDDLNDALRAIL
jgi:phage/plasmid primase-like uncharacterized protein